MHANQHHRQVYYNTVRYAVLSAIRYQSWVTTAAYLHVLLQTQPALFRNVPVKHAILAAVKHAIHIQHTEILVLNVEESLRTIFVSLTLKLKSLALALKVKSLVLALKLKSLALTFGPAPSPCNC